MRPPAVEATNLYRFYHAGAEETLALTGVNVHADAGELLAITGPSGSGKSTLIGCLAGLDEPDGGTVRIAGNQMNRRPEADRARLRARSIGLLSQAGNLIDHLTIMQNIEIAQLLADGVDSDRIARLLDEVGLGSHAGRTPSRLSGGELVRAGLAVALANDPPVVLADEPTAELDESNSDRVMALLRSRAQSGGCVVVVTHDRHVADAADRQIELRDGVVVP